MGVKGKPQKKTTVFVSRNKTSEDKRMVVREGNSALSIEQLSRAMNRLLLRVFPMIGDPALKGDIQSILLRYAEYEAVVDMRDEEEVRKEHRSKVNSKNTKKLANRVAPPSTFGAEQEDLLTGRYAKKLNKRASCSRCQAVRTMWIPHDDVAQQCGFTKQAELCGLCLFQRITVHG